MRLHARRIAPLAILAASLAVPIAAAPAHATGGGIPCGVSAVAAGGGHTLVVAGGTVYALGSNSDGQLGDGTTTSRGTAAAVSGLTGITAISAGGRHSLALGAGGVVYAWGDNAFGQLGIGSTVDKSVPMQVPGLTGITAISAGTEHSMAIGAGGVVYAWGNNITGQLGDGSTTTRTSPVQVSGLTAVSKISAGYRNSYAVKSGTLYAWGDESTWMLGNGGPYSTGNPRKTPGPVSGVPSASDVSDGWQHAMAIGTGGVVYTWGTSPYGQLGHGDNEDQPTPKYVFGLPAAATAIRAGYQHSHALLADGTVWGWGGNDVGQVGDGTNVHRTSPVKVTGLSGITALASGNEYDFAIGAGGTLYAWGHNAYGQLGDGTTTNRWSPTQVNCLPEPPTIGSVTDSPDPVAAGGTVTFSMTWTDPNAGDAVRPVICKTNAINAGTCTGGAWAVGSPTTSSPASATYTTVTADVGTRPYYAFACDTTSRCSPSVAGSFTVTGTAPTATSATDTPDPVLAGNAVTFSVGWTDPNAADSVRAVICKTNAVNAGTCTGGAWAVGSLSSTSPSTTSYTTTNADLGTRSYWAFACDAANLCSASIAGSFTVTSAAPVATSVEHDPDPVVAGHPVTFSVGWTDGNPGDRQRAVICKTDAVSAGSCPGGAWAVGVITPATPATATYNTGTADIGLHDYYAFVCDSTNLCSASVASSFRVQPQACSDGADNDGDGRADYPNDPGCSGPEDETEGPTCPPLADGVVVCLTVGAVTGHYDLDYATPSTTLPPTNVAGHLDLYRFVVADVTTTVPCVQLDAIGSSTSPCALAGGTFVSRVATLVSTPAPLQPAGSLTRVTVCHAELTVTVLGAGVESTPAYSIC